MQALALRYVAALAFSFLCFLGLTTADVSFTAPAAGANVDAGLIEVQWEDSGIAPPISELTQFTLSLMTGGNDDGEMLPLTTFVSSGDFTSGKSAQGTIPAGIAAGIDNGFFFRITSTKEQGGIVINYSSRFSIDGLTGATPLRFRQAANALDGSTEGPAAVGDSSSSTSSSTGAASTTQSVSSKSEESLTTSTPSPAKTSETSAPTSGPSSTSAPDSGLSVGAIAGIAVGAVFFGLIILGAIITFLCVRRQKVKREVQEIDPPGHPFLDGKAELSSEEFKPYAMRSTATELSTESGYVEAGDGQRPAELDHMVFRAELEGSVPPSPNTVMREKGFC